MSYSAVVAESEPYFYFPMTARLENGFPIDFSGNSLLEVEGFFDYRRINDFLGPFLHLFDESSAQITQFNQNLTQFSVSLWIFADYNSSDIVSLAGLTLQSNYSEEVWSLVANSSVVFQSAPGETVNICVVFNESSGFVYVNGSQVYSFTPGALDEINFLSEGEKVVGEISFYERVLSDEEILSLFNVGFTGSDIVSLSTESQISFSGDFKSHFQTVWQAYGIITTKK